MSAEGRLNFVAQLHNVQAKRDGTGKVTLETGMDALPAMQTLLGMLAKGDINLAIAIVPINISNYDKKTGLYKPIISDTGEIKLED